MRLSLLVALLSAFSSVACGGLLAPVPGTDSSADSKPGGGLVHGVDDPTITNAKAGSGPGCHGLAAATDVAIDPGFQGAYSVYRLNTVPGLSADKYGGMVLKAGDPNTLLIGQGANVDAGAIFAVKLVRRCGHIVGFDGAATKIASAPNIDGSIAYAPNGVLLYTAWPANTLGQIPAGADISMFNLELSPRVSSSVGTLTVVPEGFPGAGSIKIVSFDTGAYYQASLRETGGFYDVTNIKEKLTLPGGPEGVAYVPRFSQRFSGDAMIVSEWRDNSVAAYPLDADGDPLVGQRVPMLTNVKGAEGALFDPATGDFLFSTWEDGEPADLYAVHGLAGKTK